MSAKDQGCKQKCWKLQWAVVTSWDLNMSRQVQNGTTASVGCIMMRQNMKSDAIPMDYSSTQDVQGMFTQCKFMRNIGLHTISP